MSKQDFFEFVLVRDLVEQFKAHNKERHGTSDSRFGDEGLSLGYWVLVLIGFLPEITHQVYTKLDLFIAFRNLYKSYDKGKKIDMKELSKEYRRACRYVMSVADVIGATPSVCADERIYLDAHSIWIVIDEAGKVMKMFLLFVFAYFSYCRRFILAEDIKQNDSNQSGLTVANCHFSYQGKVSILERAMITGAARVY